MPTRATAALLAAAVLATAAGGCGESGGAAKESRASSAEPDRAAVLRTLRRADRALGRERYQRACSYYTADAQRKLVEATGAASCLGALALLDYVAERAYSREDLAALAKDRPQAVKVKGDRAIVRFGPPPRSVRDTFGSERSDIDLVKVGRRWLISSFTGLEAGTVV